MPHNNYLLVNSLLDSSLVLDEGAPKQTSITADKWLAMEAQIASLAAGQQTLTAGQQGLTSSVSALQPLAAKVASLESSVSTLEASVSASSVKLAAVQRSSRKACDSSTEGEIIFVKEDGFQGCDGSSLYIAIIFLSLRLESPLFCLELNGKASFLHRQMDLNPTLQRIAKKSSPL